MLKKTNSWTPLLVLTFFTPVLFFIHQAAMPLFSPPFRADDLLNTYIFLYALYAIVLVFFVWLEKKHPQLLGFAFLGGGLIKMMAVVFYLLPDLLDHVPNAKALVIQTMVPYFILLALETSLIYTRIRKIL